MTQAQGACKAVAEQRRLFPEKQLIVGRNLNGDGQLVQILINFAGFFRPRLIPLF